MEHYHGLDDVELRLGSLLCGGVLCLYDGAANYPNLGQQWRFAKEHRINHFGNGAPFYTQCMKTPPQALTTEDFPALKTLGSTGHTCCFDF